MLDGLPSVMWFIRWQMRGHRAGGLSVAQFRTLAQLDRFARLSLSCVAENLGCSLPTASRMMVNMVSGGLVKRRAVPGDRRQMSLLLTPRGRALLQEARRGAVAEMADRLAPLSGGQKRELRRVMVLLQSLFTQGTFGEPGPKPARPSQRRGTRPARRGA